MAIAGSDSSCRAGLQTDLRTFYDIGVDCVCAVTCVTAQGGDGVIRIDPCDPSMVSTQIKTACKQRNVKAVKVGMLYSKKICLAVERALKNISISNVVIDPVMKASSGEDLIEADALKSLFRLIRSCASVVTPNIPEAQIITGNRIMSVNDMKDAAVEIGKKFRTACVVKGGHLSSRKSRNSRTTVDVLFYNGKIEEFSARRQDHGNTRGTGCVFSSALACYLCKGMSMSGAVRSAKRYMSRVLMLKD